MVGIDKKRQVLTQDEAFEYGSIVPPIYQTSTFTFANYDSLEDRYSGKSNADIYSRTENPTSRILEDKLAQLEGGEAAAVFGSGMAAISSTVLALVKSGDKVISVQHAYSDAYRLFEVLLKQFNISVEYVDCSDLEALDIALSGAKLLFLESPSSFTFETHDIRAVAQLAKKYKTITLIDNSFATPLYQNPIEHGIDLVVHSLSKYLSGHSDVVAGCTIGSEQLIKKIRDTSLSLLGGKLSAMESSLILRGMRTLELRLKAHSDAADYILTHLEKDHRITQINFPGYSSTIHDSLTGTGGLFSIQLAEGANIKAFCDAMTIFRLGVSWGGYESLMLPVEVAGRIDSGPNAINDFGVHRNTVRLFVGLEGNDLLLQDILSGLEAAFSSDQQQISDLDNVAVNN